MRYRVPVSLALTLLAANPARLGLDVAQKGKPGGGTHPGTVKSKQDRFAVEGEARGVSSALNGPW